MTTGPTTTTVSPACDHSVLNVIKLAQKVLRTRVQSKMHDTGIEQENARLWDELLQQSHDGVHDGTAPMILRGDLSAPVGIKLTGRRWEQFEKWFATTMKKPLRDACEAEGLPMLYPGRISNRRGGYSERSEAQYFVSFIASPPTNLSHLTTEESTDVDESSFPLNRWPSAPAKEAKITAPVASGNTRDPDQSPSGLPSGGNSSVRLQQQVLLEDENSLLKRMVIERDLYIEKLKDEIEKLKDEIQRLSRQYTPSTIAGTGAGRKWR